MISEFAFAIFSRLFFGVSLKRLTTFWKKSETFSFPSAFSAAAGSSLLDPLSVFLVSQLMDSPYKLLSAVKILFNKDSGCVRNHFLGCFLYCSDLRKKVIQPVNDSIPVPKKGSTANQSSKRTNNP